MGNNKIEHNTEVVARLLNGLEAASNGLEVKALSSSSDLSSNFMSSVKRAEKEFDDMIASLREYKALFKNDITRIRKASEEIVSNEKQIASKLNETLGTAIRARANAK
ncbi:hypothetical protein ABE429_002336 [Listeria monocytogenes]|nr:hypothetical protein [Listeria monocytogenes]